MRLRDNITFCYDMSTGTSTKIIVSIDHAAGIVCDQIRHAGGGTTRLPRLCYCNNLEADLAHVAFATCAVVSLQVREELDVVARTPLLSAKLMQRPIATPMEGAHQAKFARILRANSGRSPPRKKLSVWKNKLLSF